MKNTIEVIKTVTNTVTNSVTCDLCRKTYAGTQWGSEYYATEDTEVSYRTGSSFPSGGSYTKYEVDICPSCFETALIPWLRNQGAEITETEVDF